MKGIAIDADNCPAYTGYCSRDVSISGVSFKTAADESKLAG
jgi:hypothetical protein